MLDLDVSAETLAVAERLRETPIGATVTWDELSAVIGRDARAHRYFVTSARRALVRDDGIVFASERGIGYRRLAAEDVHKVGAHYRRKISRASARAARTITSALRPANGLSEDSTRQALREVSTLRLLEHLASEPAQSPVSEAPTKPEPVALTARRMMERILG